MPLKTRHFIWIFSVLIIGQSLWVHFRIDNLRLKQGESYPVEKREEIEEELTSVPEPEIDEQLPKGGRLKIIPSEGHFKNNFQLEIWGQANKPIEKVGIELYYPASLIKPINSADLQVDQQAGRISFSTTYSSAKKQEFLVKTINFKPLATGIAKLKFDFNPESMLDSNLITKEGVDILEKVEGATFNVEK